MRLAFGRPLALILSSTSVARAFAPYPRVQKLSPVVYGRVHRGGAQRFMSKSESEAVATSDNLRVGLCQFHVTPDKETNHATCSSYIERAAQKGAQLIVLPEIWASPYATAAFPEYAEELPSVGDKDLASSPSAKVLHDAAIAHGVWIVGGSIAEKENGNIYNTCLVFNPEGELVAKHRKVHLFDIDVPGGITFFESDTLTAGATMTDFDTPFCKVGVGICYDIRFAAYAMLLQEKGCKILIYPGAFNMTTGPAHWELLQRARALDNQCYVLTASPARTEPPETPGKYPHYTAWGHSTVVSLWGEVIATTDEKEGIVVADLDLSKLETIRGSIPISKQKRTDLYKVEQG